ncbi:MAG: hypothetical protein NVSMB17_05290 [Candidatus Dormibacteria bacterium]
MSALRTARRSPASRAATSSAALGPLTEAVEIARGLGARWHVATSQLNLGHATAAAGDLTRGTELVEAALAIYEALGDQDFAARSRVQLGFLAVAAGDTLWAGELFETSLASFRASAERWGTAEAIEGLAVVAAAQQRDLDAARLAGTAGVLRAALVVLPMPFDRAVIEPHLDAARARLGERAWREAFDAGWVNLTP